MRAGIRDVRYLIAIAGCLVWTCRQGMASSAPDEDQQVIHQYQSALAKMESDAAKSYLTGKLTISMSRNGKVFAERKTDVLVARDEGKVLLRVSNRDYTKSAYHPQRIRRSTEQEAHLFVPPKYYVARQSHENAPYQLATNQVEKKPVANTSSYYNDRLLGAPFSLLSRPIIELLKEKDFSITKAERMDDRSEQWKMHFVSKIKTDTLAPCSGWFLVDPTIGWALVGYEYSMVEPADAANPRGEMVHSNEKGKVVYGTPSDGHATPVRIELSRSSSGGDGVKTSGTDVLEVTEYARHPYPAREFTLAYYGLKDDEGEHRSNARWRAVVFTSIAALIAVLSVVAREYKRSRATPEPVRPAGEQA